MEEKIEIKRNVQIPKASKYPFADLKVGDVFESNDIGKHATIRSRATREGKILGWKFKVKKELRGKGINMREVIAVYRIK